MIMLIPLRQKIRMSDLISNYWTKKPPIEGRPTMKDEDKYWQKQYAEQRKDRMQDAIDDYLQDDSVDARQTYEEILSCVQDVINYHKKEYAKAQELYDLMLGYRQIESLYDVSLGEK